MPSRLPLIIIFVRRFEHCLKFYKNAFSLKLLRIYRGRRHPSWAELKLDDSSFALHSEYKGAPYRKGPVVIQFTVKNMPRTIERIKRYGGSIKISPERIHLFPELVVVLEGNSRILMETSSMSYNR